MRILLIEDDKIQRDKLIKIIEKKYINIKIYEAGSIKDAIKVIKEKQIDLFLIDVNLPDGSGIELGKKIRTIQRHELTGMIFITTQVIQIVQAFKSTHCYDFIVKPYTEDDITTAINIFYKKFDDMIVSDRDFIIVPIDMGVSSKIYEDEIIFIQYSNRKCIINTVNNIVECKSLTLSKILDFCKSETIIQSHKSYIINTRYINKIEKVYTKLWNAHFINSQEIAQVSNSYKDKIYELWKN